jgi:excisionase family DNA binding protein
MTFQKSFLSRREAADYLGVSLSTIDRLLRVGAIPFVRIRGRVCVPKDRIDGWVHGLEAKRRSGDGGVQS